MSRSNPQITQNPSTRWMEWNGEKGNLRYYDKAEEVNVEIDLPFNFLLLDQLAKVGGWYEPNETNIYSNEVKDITREILTVQTSGTNVLAKGKYADIKDAVKSKGGYYLASLYIAYKDNGELKIGNIGLKGAALSAWMDFTRKHGINVYEKAVVVDGFEEGKKGSVTYRFPTFKLKEVSEESNQEALALDKRLQEYLGNRPDYSDPETIEDTGQSEEPPLPESPVGPTELYGEDIEQTIEEDDLPF